MALKLALEKNMVGYPFPDAYARIIHYSGDKGNIAYRVYAWASEEARQAGYDPILDVMYHVEISPSVVLLESLYNHLKTQELFANAVDV